LIKDLPSATTESLYFHPTYLVAILTLLRPIVADSITTAIDACKAYGGGLLMCCNAAQGEVANTGPFDCALFWLPLSTSSPSRYTVMFFNLDLSVNPA
jgi:hypothetical protein